MYRAPFLLAALISDRALRGSGALIVSCLWLALTGCQGERAATDGPRPAGGKRAAVLVQVWDAAPSTVIDRIESIGTLLGNESVTITAKVTDQVQRIRFTDGQMVKAGDVLVELVDVEQLALRDEAAADLRQASLQLERLRKLGSDISTGAQIDVAEAEVEASRARQAAIAARIEDRLIRAPFDGQLGFRRVSLGALVTPGTVITELDDISRMKLDFSVPETHLALVQVGNRVDATSPAFPGETFVGEVVSIGSRIDPVTRAITVRAMIDNSRKRLLPGMLMGVELIAAEREALVLPEQALIQVAGDSMVYVVDAQSNAERRSVTIGKRVPGGVVILAGIGAGEKVVINGQFNLRPGSAVQVVPASAGAEPDTRL